MRHLAFASSKPLARLRLLIWSQRKLFLLVFLWTCLCLTLLHTARQPSLAVDLSDPGGGIGAGDGHHHQRARSAASVRPAAAPAVSSAPSSGSSEQPLLSLEILAPELDLDATNVDSTSDQTKQRHHYQMVAAEDDEKQKQQQQQQRNGDDMLEEDEEDKKVSPIATLKSSTGQDQQDQQEQQQQQQKQQQQQQATSEMREASSSLAVGRAASSVRTRTPARPPPPAHKPIPGDQCHYNYPNLFDLQFNNIHWQKFTTSSRELNLTSDSLKPATFYLYNAYYDDRWRAGQPSVRVLAMIDRIHPPATNCLLWFSRAPSDDHDEGSTTTTSSSKSAQNNERHPVVTRAQFVYAWYPKWGNYEDGLLQPWIVTCPVPRDLQGRVPDSVSLVDLPTLVDDDLDSLLNGNERKKRDLHGQDHADSAFPMPMPPSYSSSSSSSSSLARSPPASHSSSSPLGLGESSTAPTTGSTDQQRQYDCSTISQPLTNNLPVFNRRPRAGSEREKFAVCVKGLDFPSDNEHVSVRLVEWIELLNLLGAKKIFLYNLDVHENISKVLHYYQRRGLVELSPLTLPGDQPNLPEYQHLYLKQKLTSKRQNELLPYNDCLYRNLYSYQYLALLDIDEIIMPLKSGHNNWYDLMEEVERVSLVEQNYSRASYNVRNVYFFDDLSGPLGTTQSSRPSTIGLSSTSTSASASQVVGENKQQQQQRNHRSGGHDSAERGIPHYLHMMSHVYRSKNYTEPGQYVKCFHNTERVISLHNHFPMNCFGQCTTYSIPVDLAHLQHYRKDCVGPLRQSCKNDFRLFTTRDTTIWKYKQRMIKRTTRALSHLGLLANNNNNNNNNNNHGQNQQQAGA